MVWLDKNARRKFLSMRALIQVLILCFENQLKTECFYVFFIENIHLYNTVLHMWTYVYIFHATYITANSDDAEAADRRHFPWVEGMSMLNAVIRFFSWRNISKEERLWKMCTYKSVREVWCPRIANQNTTVQMIGDARFIQNLPYRQHCSCWCISGDKD